MLRDPGILADTLAAAECAAVRAFALEARRCLGADLRRLVLYGSRARGDHHAGSDIDVLAVVTGAPGVARARLRRLAAELNLEHDSDLSILVLGEDEYAALRARERRLIRDIEREAIDL